jgi:hypothetical protein
MRIKARISKRIPSMISIVRAYSVTVVVNLNRDSPVNIASVRYGRVTPMLIARNIMRRINISVWAPNKRNTLNKAGPVQGAAMREYPKPIV